MRRVVVAVLVLMIGGMFVGALPADAVHAPTVVLSQTTGVLDGQKLIVNGAHWIPGSVVDGAECSPQFVNVGLVACSGPFANIASSTGRIRTKIQVHKDSVGSAGYACRTKCLVLLYERDNTAMSAYAKFTFAA